MEMSLNGSFMETWIINEKEKRIWKCIKTTYWFLLTEQAFVESLSERI